MAADIVKKAVQLSLLGRGKSAAGIGAVGAAARAFVLASVVKSVICRSTSAHIIHGHQHSGKGVPGLAKTLSVNTLAKVLGLDFKRISFTPDLLPADVVGTLIYSPKTVASRAPWALVA